MKQQHLSLLKINKVYQQFYPSIVSSQVDVHKEFGGVVPELAARSHIEKIDLITKKAIEESDINTRRG